MAKTICSSCGSSKGNRNCVHLDGKIICPVCCVAKRSEHCLICEHYRAAKRKEIERFRTTGKHPFVLNMAHEDGINAILDQLDESTDGNLASKELEKYVDMTSHLYFFARGLICALQHDPEEAALSFQKCLSIFPYFTPGWYNLSGALLKAARIPEAYDACQILLNLSAPNTYFFELAKERLRDLEEFAEENTSFSLKEYIERYRQFEYCYRLIFKAPQKAADGFIELLEKEPDHVQCHGNLGLCYAFLGRKADAERELRKALELDPGYDIARRNLEIVAKMQEGSPLPESRECSCLGIEFYKQKYRLENSRNLLEKQAIRELFALCGITPTESPPADKNK